jgi:uncharacterized membrane protein
MELVLLVALLVLWALHGRLSRRVGALEREVEHLRAGQGPAPVAAPAETDPIFQPRAQQPMPAAEPRRRWSIDAPAPEPQVGDAPVPEAAAAENLGGMFERFVGGRLLVWVGGIALAVAGVFLVRYSIEIGLITPPVRMIMAGVFGLILLAAGELARSRPGGTVDPRTGQSLVGAGILVLYSAVYGSLVLYQLIGNGAAFALMVVVTGVALVLSLRQGAPAAVMGLIGGFATPLLVGERSETAVPLLTYLALLDVAVFTLAARRGWTWLAAGAVLLSFGWSGALLFWPAEDAIAAGIFILLVSLGGSLLRTGEGWHLDFIRPAAIGLIQLAMLAARADIGLPAWCLFGILSAACFFLAQRKSEYRWLPPIALVLALVVSAAKAAAWTDPTLPWVGLGITVLFAGGSLPAAQRRREALLATATAAAAIGGPLLIFRLVRPELLDRPLWAILFLLGALGPLFLSWLRRAESEDEDADLPLFLAAATAMLLAGIAAYDLLPLPLLGSAWLGIALASAVGAKRMRDSGLTALALIAIAVAVLWSLAMLPRLWGALLFSFIGDPALAADLPGIGRTLEVLVLPLPLLVLLWRVLPRHYSRIGAAPLAVAGLFAVLAAYILFKQAFGLSSVPDFVARGFAERTLINQALFVAGWLLCSGRVQIPSLDERLRRRAGTLLTALAAARLFWLDILIHNPALADQWVGSLPMLNLLLPAYLLSAFWLYRLRRTSPSEARSGLWLTLFLAALIVGVALLVRQLFWGVDLNRADILASESYGYSLAGLLLSIAMLLGGIRLRDKALRLAGLLLLTATTCKVFLSDAAALEGLLRILSFLGLGVALIGIGKLYTKVLNAEARPSGSPS